MWLLILSIILFAGYSQAMMSYLVMHWSLGPWFGPIFVVVCMTLVAPFVSSRWFKEHAIVTIAAGSIGGMVGMCLGMTIPAFYFLHKAEFLTWISSPFLFASIVSLLIFCAGIFAFLIAYLMKNYLLNENQYSFPVTKVIHDIVSLEQYAPEHRLMWIGVTAASIWNSFLFITRFALSSFIMKLQVIPLLVSVGFIAGHLVTISTILGLINRVFALNILQKYFFEHVSDKEFLIIFSLGMLAVQISHTFFNIVWSVADKNNVVNLMEFLKYLKGKVLDRFIITFMVLLTSGFILYAFGLSMYELTAVFLIVFFMALNAARIVGTVGIIGFDGFVWCILLLLLYGSTISSVHLLLVAAFSTVCLGMVIDLIFSYKLTQLSNISYSRVLRYQLIGFFVVIITSGFVMWYYAQSFDEQSLHLFAGDAQELDALINFGIFNHKIFICGALAGVLILLTGQSLLSVVGMTLMDPYISIWLIITGAVSFFVPDRQKLYPLWFGVYAAHAIWLIIWALS